MTDQPSPTEFAQATSEAASEVATKAAEQASHAFDEAHAFLKRQWTERPLAVAVVAVGLGALIGLALSKRR